MQQNIATLSLPLPFGMGRVNCYLLQTKPGFILIDTGGSNGRKELLKALANANCQPGMLQLILITHGDFDHTGNAAYLRKIFGGKIAMHQDDLGMVKDGDMFYNRQKPNVIIRKLASLYAGSGRKDRFTPDLFVEDGFDFSEYGFDAKVVSLPGHSKGSIGILAASGDLFCGDLLINSKKPTLNSLIDNVVEANLSLQKLFSLGTQTVYPGHGDPFQLSKVKAGSQ
jgi:hydroxyacylglutathione hydrolase